MNLFLEILYGPYSEVVDISKLNHDERKMSPREFGRKIVGRKTKKSRHQKKKGNKR